MRALMLAGLAIAFAIPQGTAEPKGCSPLANVQFICGLVGPEDLVSVPGSDWVVASGDAAPGAITLVNVREKTTTPLYPNPAMRQRLDAKTYDSCPGPIDPEEKDKFRRTASLSALAKAPFTLCTSSITATGNRSRSSSSICAASRRHSPGSVAPWRPTRSG